jgi:hypothetical protein
VRFADAVLHRAASKQLVLFENVKYIAAAEITNADAIHPDMVSF